MCCKDRYVLRDGAQAFFIPGTAACCVAVPVVASAGVAVVVAVVGAPGFVMLWYCNEAKQLGHSKHFLQLRETHDKHKENNNLRCEYEVVGTRACASTVRVWMCARV